MIRDEEQLLIAAMMGELLNFFFFEHEEGRAGTATNMVGLGSNVKRVGNVMEHKLPHSCCLWRWGT